jgi:hypothetical protein
MVFHYKYFLSVRNENKDEIDYKYIGTLDYSNKFSMKKMSYSKKLHKLYDYKKDEEKSNGEKTYKILDIQTFSEMTSILLESPITAQEEEAYYDTYYTLQWANDIIYKKRYNDVHFVFVEELINWSDDTPSEPESN